MASAGGSAPPSPRPQAVFEQWGEYRVQVSPALGGGLTAQVFLAERGGAPFALKRFGLSKVGLGGEDLAMLRSSAAAEVGLLQHLAHPCVVRMHDQVDVGEDICLALDFAPGASAKARMRTAQGSGALLSIDQIAWVARDIAEALAYLHGDPLGGGPVLHRDIKPGNIVFTAEGQARLTDFGSAALLQEVKQRSKISKTGTVGFMAPEMHTGEPASKESDVWMYGATLLCLLTGEEVADDLRVVQSFNNMAKPWTLEDHVHCRLQGLNSDEDLVPLQGLGLSEGERSVWEAAPAELKDLIQGCLRKRKKDRLGAAALLAHPFVATVEARFSPRRPTPPLEGLPRWPFPAPAAAEPHEAAPSPGGSASPLRALTHGMQDLRVAPSAPSPESEELQRQRLALEQQRQELQEEKNALEETVRKAQAERQAAALEAERLAEAEARRREAERLAEAETRRREAERREAERREAERRDAERRDAERREAERQAEWRRVREREEEELRRRAEREEEELRRRAVEEEEEEEERGRYYSSPSRSYSSSSQVCGAATQRGTACQNPRGSCPHHSSSRGRGSSGGGGRMCGAETARGTPCQNPRGSCPWH